MTKKKAVRKTKVKIDPLVNHREHIEAHIQALRKETQKKPETGDQKLDKIKNYFNTLGLHNFAFCFDSDGEAQTCCSGESNIISFPITCLNNHFSRMLERGIRKK